jgi:hypothetical protein
MSENKTQPKTQATADFIAAVDYPTRRADALVLDAMSQDITGWLPKMWGPSIVA